MKKRGSVSLVALMFSLSCATSAYAQETDKEPAAHDEVGGTVVVTARKREEDILKVPVTVSTLNAEQMEKRSVVSIADLANNTPGLNINNNSSGRADRTIQQVILRGFTPSTVLATTTSMFIDGVPVASSSALNNVGAAERVEVLRGPQSAYFGRNTFAGAINVVNRVPGANWAGSVTGMVGTRANYRVRGEIEGPILGDALTFRITGDHFAKDGSWVNAYDGGTLGDQQSTSASALLAAKPAAGLTIKLYGSLSRDRDGVSASTRLSAYDVTDAQGNVIIRGQSNCTLTGNTAGVPGQGTAIQIPFICGALPGLVNPVSSNTLNDSYIRNFLANPTGRVIDPKDGPQGYGMVRNYYHLHAVADYELNEAVTATFLTGYNNEMWSQFSDLDGYDSTALANPFGGPGSRSYFDFPFLGERVSKDHSVEGRIAYDSGPLRAIVGASLLDARSRNSIGGGNGALGTAVLATSGGVDRAKTVGAFFGVTYDFTPSLSFSVEGRYQVDTTYAYAGPNGLTVTSDTYIPAGYYAPDAVIAQKSFKNFLPRAIINFDIDSDTMVYASIAKGVNPGAFSTGLLVQSPAAQQAADDAGMKLLVNPEKVTNYELGLKGRGLGGALRYTLSGYYAQWRDQINSIVVIVPDATSATGNTFLSGSSNAGSVDLYGLELESAYRVNDLITVDMGGALSLSSINQFTNRSISQLSGILDFSGKEQPNMSKYSATVGVQFGGGVKGWDDSNWFWRTDWNFKSGMWSNQANIVRTPDRHLFNMRAGISHGDVSLEAFVTNLLNDKTYVSIYDNFIFTPTFDRAAYFSALLVGLPELRTAGLQMRVKF